MWICQGPVRWNQFNIRISYRIVRRAKGRKVRWPRYYQVLEGTAFYVLEDQGRKWCHLSPGAGTTREHPQGAGAWREGLSGRSWNPQRDQASHKMPPEAERRRIILVSHLLPHLGHASYCPSLIAEGFVREPSGVCRGQGRLGAHEWSYQGCGRQHTRSSWAWLWILSEVYP